MKLAKPRTHRLVASVAHGLEVRVRGVTLDVLARRAALEEVDGRHAVGLFVACGEF